MSLHGAATRDVPPEQNIDVGRARPWWKNGKDLDHFTIDDSDDLHKELIARLREAITPTVTAAGGVGQAG